MRGWGHKHPACNWVSAIKLLFQLLTSGIKLPVEHHVSAEGWVWRLSSVILRLYLIDSMQSGLALSWRFPPPTLSPPPFSQGGVLLTMAVTSREAKAGSLPEMTCGSGL